MTHLHWPVPVENIVTGEIVAYICDECFDKCDNASEVEHDGEIWRLHFPDNGGYLNVFDYLLRNRDGQVLRGFVG